jgi:hypothetical protein
MATFKAYVKKEILESNRQYRYVILGIGILFFAVASPIMLKLLPEIIKSQASGMIINMPDTTPKMSLQEFIKDLFQIVSLVVVFTVCGSISDELTTQKFVFPYAKGSRPSGIVLAKLLHYGVVVTIFIVIAFSVNYYYSTLLFKGDSVRIIDLIRSVSYISIYFFFSIALTIFLSAIIKKGIVSGIIVLGFNYFSVLFANINSIKNFLPYKLIETSSEFSSTGIYKTIVAVIIYCIVLGSLTILKMNKTEVI